jgi:hypothetical protein
MRWGCAWFSPVPTSCDYRETFDVRNVIGKPFETANRIMWKSSSGIAAFEGNQGCPQDARETLAFIGATLN